MKNSLIFTFLIIFSLTSIQAQSIVGLIQEKTEGFGFPGATVMVLNPRDSSVVAGSVTDQDGKFTIDQIAPGNYRFEARYIGYQTVSLEVTMENEPLDLGTIHLGESHTELQEVTISGRKSLGVQKGDTTQFNADAFRTMKDASAQNLVEKMPSISMVDGVLQAQGENIVQILVDGKPFFGTDVKAALQNLPAEVIESIQIYDRLSDKAALSGFDDGEQEKTINIITNPEHRKGQFGKMTAGYGTDDRYLLGMSLNAFNNDQRITVSGLSNNINAVDYSGEPNSMGNTRPQDGIIKTNSFGINFSDSWGDKIEFSSSYQYRDRTNLGNSSLVRNYLLEDGAGQRYTEQNSNSRRNREHEFDLRLEYDLDSNNHILFRSDLSTQTDLEQSFFQGTTVTGSELINQTNNFRTGDNSDLDFSNELYYSRKFRKKGRSFTTSFSLDNNSDIDDGYREAENYYYDPEERLEILNQNITRNRKGASWEVNFSYTEPLGKYGMVELEYEIGNSVNESDQRTLNIMDTESGENSFVLDTALSNTFKSAYLSQEAEIGYQYNREKFKMQVEAEIQQIELKNNQQFPRDEYLERTFTNILPTLRIDYLISSSRKLEFDYHNYTNTPSIADLQNAVDNSNPIQLRSGNPDLVQSYSNQFRIRYSSTNSDTDHSFFGFIQSSMDKNRVSSSSMIADSPIDLGDGIILERGAQLTRPVNLDGYWDLRSYANYGMPVDWLKSNLNLNGGIEYTKRPGLINDEVNFVNSARFRGGIGISSNISDRVDFNISTRSTFNLVDNTLRPNLNNNYFNQNTRFNYNWIIWKGLIFRMELSHQLNSGLEEGFDNSFLLVNMSLGKKVFKNERGEISLNIFDLFNQNTNIRRNINELYIEDRQTNVLQRYAMLTFTYNLRHFSLGASRDDF